MLADNNLNFDRFSSTVTHDITILNSNIYQTVTIVDHFILLATAGSNFQSGSMWSNSMNILISPKDEKIIKTHYVRCQRI